MFRFIAALFLLSTLGVGGMAKDGGGLLDIEPKTGRDVRQPSEMEEFYQTPEGQAAKRLMDAIRKGDKLAAQKEYEAGQELFGWKPQVPAPAARSVRPPPRVMTLPPGAN